MLLTAGMFLVTAAALWFLLAVGDVWLGGQSSRIQVLLPTVAAFFAALLTAWWRWACHTALVCFAAYAIVLACLLGGLGGPVVAEASGKLLQDMPGGLLLLGPWGAALLGGFIGEAMRD